MERFRLEVGNEHEVKVNNIVGAIANEAGVDSQYIKNVTIHENYSTVDLPMGMPNDLFKAMKKVWVSGQQLNISRMNDKTSESDRPVKKKEKKRVKSDKKRPPKRKPKPAS
jgi:ATP-dependent RNA helicase DeaD